MNQETEKIIGVAMPAEEALKIIESILRSNPAVDLFASCIFPKSHTHNTFTVGLDSLDDASGFYSDYKHMIDKLSITIDSINPIIPKYTIGDRVMILATGEIGEIERTYQDGLIRVFFTYKVKYHAANGDRLHPFVDNLHWSDICKLPAIQKPSE